MSFSFGLWRKGKWYVAKTSELDFISRGDSPEKAKKNLEEVINIQFQEMEEMGTLEEYLAECGFEIKNDIIFPNNEIIGVENLPCS